VKGAARKKERQSRTLRVQSEEERWQSQEEGG
jgi:hypothetical protein